MLLNQFEVALDFSKYFSSKYNFNYANIYHNAMVSWDTYKNIIFFVQWVKAYIYHMKTNVQTALLCKIHFKHIFTQTSFFLVYFYFLVILSGIICIVNLIVPLQKSSELWAKVWDLTWNLCKQCTNLHQDSPQGSMKGGDLWGLLVVLLHSTDVCTPAPHQGLSHSYPRTRNLNK